MKEETLVAMFIFGGIVIGFLAFLYAKSREPTALTVRELRKAGVKY